MKLSLALMTLALPLASTACDMALTDDAALRDGDAPAVTEAALGLPTPTASVRRSNKAGHWECRVKSYDPTTGTYTYYAQCVSPYGADVSSAYCPSELPKCGQSSAF